jgi:site-specific recombinase XerD
MIEDIQLRGLSERTQEMSVRAVRQLAEHDHKSPARITEEALRDSFLSLKNVQHASRSASPIALCGITCFYEHPLKREWATLTFVRAPRAKKLPVGLSVEEVRTILAHIKLLRSRGCWTTLYSCGLRLHEGPHLQVPDIDRARMLVHVRSGTGAKDRSVPLPQRTLAWLRQYWQTHRHPVWLLPAPGRGGIGMSTASNPMPRHRVQDAFRAALTHRGIHKRASVHTLRHSSAPHLLEAGVHLRLLQAYWGHNTPPTTALYTPLTVNADAMARDALTALMADL